jgi:hypothetical protein
VECRFREGFFSSWNVDLERVDLEGNVDLERASVGYPINTNERSCFPHPEG